MNIGCSLKTIRTERGLTQKQVAEAINIPYRTYQDYELNNRELSLTNALRLARFYKVSVEQLCIYGE